MKTKFKLGQKVKVKTNPKVSFVIEKITFKRNREPYYHGSEFGCAYSEELLEKDLPVKTFYIYVKQNGDLLTHVLDENKCDVKGNKFSTRSEIFKIESTGIELVYEEKEVEDEEDEDFDDYDDVDDEY